MDAKATERQDKRKYESKLEMLRLEARPGVVVTGELDDNVRRPLDQRLVQLNIPVFNDKAESIDDYLVGFEKFQTHIGQSK